MGDWKAYNYVPCQAPAIVFIIIFALLTLLSVAQIVRAFIFSKRTGSSRNVSSLLPFIIGGLFETIGYVARAISHNDTQAITPYVIQSILLLVAPALFAASIYMTLGRVMAQINCDHHSLIRVKWLTKTFVLGDVISFFMQAGGGGIMAHGNNFQTGKLVIVIGLIIQLIFFALFILVMSVFQVRVHKSPSITAIEMRYWPGSFRNWQTIIISLFACSFLIFIRSTVRVVEYIQGNDGYIQSHEWMLYVFDATLMALNMLFFISQDIGLFYVKSRQGRIISHEMLPLLDSQSHRDCSKV